jgi:hypothetical protein
MLRGVSRGKSKTLLDTNDKTKVVWSVTKEYDAEEYPGEDCLGLKILVYQESINKVIPEYLVCFEYLQERLALYGFELVPDEEAKSMGFPSGSDTFDQVYGEMKDIKMNDNEKTISFLNRYFMFRKTFSANAEEVMKSFRYENRGVEEYKEPYDEPPLPVAPSVAPARRSESAFVDLSELPESEVEMKIIPPSSVEVVFEPEPEIALESEKKILQSAPKRKTLKKRTIAPQETSKPKKRRVFVVSSDDEAVAPKEQEDEKESDDEDEKESKEERNEERKDERKDERNEGKEKKSLKRKLT